MTALSPAARACLRDLVELGPLELETEWAADGDRRMLFFYTRPKAGRHFSGALIELAAAGWLEPVAPEFRYFAATDAGKAAWARLAQQAA